MHYGAAVWLLCLRLADTARRHWRGRAGRTRRPSAAMTPAMTQSARARMTSAARRSLGVLCRFTMTSRPPARARRCLTGHAGRRARRLQHPASRQHCQAVRAARGSQRALPGQAGWHGLRAGAHPADSATSPAPRSATAGPLRAASPCSAAGHRPPSSPGCQTGVMFRVAMRTPAHSPQRHVARRRDLQAGAQAQREARSVRRRLRRRQLGLRQRVAPVQHRVAHAPAAAGRRARAAGALEAHLRRRGRGRGSVPAWRARSTE